MPSSTRLNSKIEVSLTSPFFGESCVSTRLWHETLTSPGSAVNSIKLTYRCALSLLFVGSLPYLSTVGPCARQQPSGGVVVVERSDQESFAHTTSPSPCTSQAEDSSQIPHQLQTRVSRRKAQATLFQVDDREIRRLSSLREREWGKRRDSSLGAVRGLPATPRGSRRSGPRCRRGGAGVCAARAESEPAVGDAPLRIVSRGSCAHSTSASYCATRASAKPAPRARRRSLW